MSLDKSKLENIRDSGNGYTARCPACKESGKDKKGDHLSVDGEGKFACVMYPKPDGTEHRTVIFNLAGIKSAPKEKSIWTALASAPANAPVPSLKHFKHRNPSASWTYRAADGGIAGIVARFDLPNGKKDVIPMAWCKDQHGNTGWQWKGMKTPCPLYGWPAESDEVIIVEGEKCADAIKAIGLPGITWPGGSPQVRKGDWAQLKGKRCTIWSDNDPDGAKAQDALVSMLSGIASEIRVVPIPEGRPPKWDCADTDEFEIRELIEKAQPVTAPKPVEAAKNGIVPFTPETQDASEELDFRAYYDGTKFYLDNGKDFVPMDGRSIKAHVKLNRIDPADETICRIQTENYIKYNGPLAGKMRGVYESNGDLLLAATSPRIIQSKPGKYPAIKQFITDLFSGDDHANTQVEAFLGWMAIARRAMIEGKRRPGQALVLAGPIACGKTQLIKQVITPSMGGREAKPYKYLSGKTGFNGDLIGAEVLVIDDEAASTRIEGRRALGDGIKTSLFASSVRIEGKFRTGFDFAPLWRIIIAVNDQPEALMVLPPLSHDLSDKLMILKCQKALELSDEDFEIWQATIAAELPAFLHVLEHFEIKPENVDGRCGVKSFYHPDVVDAISELSPEHQLRTMIEALESSGGIALPWDGTSAALKAILTSPSSPVRLDADRLLGSWPAACGVYLSRLVGKGVEKLPLRDGDQRWRISKSGEVDTK